MTAVFLHGAPYKYNKVLKAHTRFLQDVAYSHDGEHFVTVGSDAKVSKICHTFRPNTVGRFV